MPYDKLVDSAFLDNGLTQIADSIRAKTGTEDELAFPSGMSEAIDGISGGDTGIYAFTDFSYFCYNGARLDSLEYIDTKLGTSFAYMFWGCNKLESIPEINTGNSNDFTCMFTNCSNLTSIPEIDTSKGSIFNNMFEKCSKLTSIPEIDTSNGVNLNNMFNGCVELTTISKLDLRKANNISSIFNTCYKLTDLYLYNVSIPITIGVGTYYGHLLTVDSLVHIIRELTVKTWNRTLSMGSVNLEKIANLYCRVLDDTTEKIEMELCESTDEGAMTLSEYASLKNWTFA